MESQQTFREQVRDRLAAAFGEPTVIRVDRGEIYRWKLPRPYSLDVYLTLDAPELPDLAHLMISDPKAMTIDPVQSVCVRTVEELERIVVAIRRQWKAE